MFTGLVQESAILSNLQWNEGRTLLRLSVESQLPAARSWNLGDSIALDGVCLSIAGKSEVALVGTRLDFDLSPETLACSTFAEAKVGTLVHLEPAMRLGDVVGGHLVSGHVDAVGEILAVNDIDDCKNFSLRLRGAALKNVSPFLVRKGSLAVDGVSLTVNDVRDGESYCDVDFMIIPHTLKVTKFKYLKPTMKVNIEADMMAKYVARANKVMT